MRGQGELAVFRLQAVNVNRPVGRLCRNEFVEGIPGYSLHIMRMLRDLTHHLT
jgi:hypothetical protein